MIILRLPDDATLEDADKAFVALRLKRAEYNVSEAARCCGLNRDTIRKWVLKWGWDNDGYIGPPEDAPRAAPAANTPEPATPAPPGHRPKSPAPQPSLLYRPEMYDPETCARADALLRRKKENGEV